MAGPPIRHPIPPACWGKDHWSTFAYVETCCVDRGGRLDPRRMRTRRRPHRDPSTRARLRGPAPHTPALTGAHTRLRDWDGAADHDDWDCLADLIAAGLVTSSPRRAGPAAAGYALTPLGWEVAGRLRAHRAGGGRLAEFRLDPGGDAGAPHILVTLAGVRGGTVHVRRAGHRAALCGVRPRHDPNPGRPGWWYRGVLGQAGSPEEAVTCRRCRRLAGPASP